MPDICDADAAGRRPLAGPGGVPRGATSSNVSVQQIARADQKLTVVMQLLLTSWSRHLRRELRIAMLDNAVGNADCALVDRQPGVLRLLGALLA